MPENETEGSLPPPGGPPRELKGTTRPRVELPKALWRKVKTAAAWLNRSSSGLVTSILSEWLDKHVSFAVNGEEIEVRDMDSEVD